ncbi:hypothetical protein E2C01_011813 [Portunus trituberculatus]|uniref:Uncharacterized protein n=1 Tax=Portunus trituberculatus TaxID=210409 RepID=A0A5B7DC54_PORTR|nr:hypothetical protein [Portunus trituberculatus]
MEIWRQDTMSPARTLYNTTSDDCDDGDVEGDVVDDMDVTPRPGRRSRGRGRGGGGGEEVGSSMGDGDRRVGGGSPGHAPAHNDHQDHHAAPSFANKAQSKAQHSVSTLQCLLLLLLPPPPPPPPPPPSHSYIQINTNIINSQSKGPISSKCNDKQPHQPTWLPSCRACCIRHPHVDDTLGLLEDVGGLVVVNTHHLLLVDAQDHVSHQESRLQGRRVMQN